MQMIIVDGASFGWLWKIIGLHSANVCAILRCPRTVQVHCTTLLRLWDSAATPHDFMATPQESTGLCGTQHLLCCYFAGVCSSLLESAGVHAWVVCIKMETILGSSWCFNICFTDILHPAVVGELVKRKNPKYLLVLKRIVIYGLRTVHNCSCIT